MENIFVEFLPPWVETGLQPAFYDKESGTVLQQTARMYARVNMLIRMFNKLSKQTKEEVESFEGTVNDEIERFEGTVNDTVEEYITKFNDLHDYVHDYFDNLDVQQEINHKLDEMVSDGTIQDIIYNYLQPKVIWSYNTVADMKADTNLTDGDFAETYGFYQAGDGGSAKYIIKTADVSDVIDESTIIAISDTLNAHLIINDEMYVKQFGCKGDNSTDDTTKFTIATTNVKRLLVNEGTYLIDRFTPSSESEVVGIGDAILNLKGTTAPLCNILSNTTLSHLTINSTNDDLQWNRCAIDAKDNITIEYCNITGFRHSSLKPNAWGILIQGGSNITINNCYFDNNSQSDIALTNNCKNIAIDQCSGTNLYINVEPNNADTTNESISISNSKLHQLNVLENSYNGTATKSLLVENCEIDLLKYDGGTTTLLNCKVNDISNENAASNVIYAGILNLYNAMNLSKNILEDPYIDCFHQSTTSTLPWFTSYFSSAIASSIVTVNDENGIQTQFNPNNATNITARMEHQPVSVVAGDKYLVKINSKTQYPNTGTNWRSLNVILIWKDNDNAQIKREVISLNRAEVNTTTPFTEQSAVLVVPTGATKLSIQLCIATSPDAGVTASQSFYIRSIELLKFNPNSEPNSIPALPIRAKREFTLPSTLTGQGTYYNVGDRLNFETPSTYIGQVCTVAGYGNSATWKNYGAIAS